MIYVALHDIYLMNYDKSLCDICVLKLFYNVLIGIVTAFLKYYRLGIHFYCNIQNLLKLRNKIDSYQIYRS